MLEVFEIRVRRVSFSYVLQICSWIIYTAEWNISNDRNRIHLWRIFQVKALAAGADHSMALSAKGIVYLWGSSEHGQLGLGRKKQRKLPVQLKTEGKALVISAGAYHSAYVNSDGHLFTFGSYLFSYPPLNTIIFVICQRRCVSLTCYSVWPIGSLRRFALNSATNWGRELISPGLDIHT